MLTCSCGGVFMVIKVEDENITGVERLHYLRKCTVKCSKCEKVRENQLYD